MTARPPPATRNSPCMRCSTASASRRSDVQQLAPPTRTAAKRWCRKRLRPAATTECWQARAKTKDFDAAAARALTSLAMIEAANAEEEALAIAVALREALEDKAKTAALVTPDRALARRVIAALERWQVKVDDSGGDALADTAAGVFARLAAEAALGGLEPVTLLALLKHPLLRLGAKEGAHNAAIADAGTRAAARAAPTPRQRRTCARALDLPRQSRAELHRSDPRWLIDDDEFDVAAELIARLGAALAPLERLKHGSHPLAALAKCHSAVISGLGRDAKGDVAAFTGHDGTALARALEELIESPSAAGLAVAQKRLRRVVPRRRRPTARCAGRKRRTCACSIYGPLEARLQTLRPRSCSAASTKAPGRRRRATIPGSAARCAAISASIRPSAASASPRTTSRRRLGAPEVILARAAKIAGAPTVTSRFVQRIAALAGEARWKEVLARGNSYLELARALDHPVRGEIRRTSGADAATRRAAARAVGHRHRRLAARSLHHLRQIYSCACSRSMRSTRRPARATAAPSSTAPSATTRNCSPPTPPADPLKELLALGEKHFATLADYPEARAFWWPRFVRIAQWFAQWDGERRADDQSAACRNPRRAEFPRRQTRVHVLRHRRPYRAAHRTAATPSSTTRPARRAPRSRCARVSPRN